MPLKSAMAISNAQLVEVSLEQIRAAGERLVDAIYEGSETIRRANGDIEAARQAIERVVELERRKLQALYGKAADIGDLVIWDLDDRTDPTGEMRLIGRAMGRSPAEGWSPRRVADQLDRMHKPMP